MVVDGATQALGGAKGPHRNTHGARDALVGHLDAHAAVGGGGLVLRRGDGSLVGKIHTQVRSTFH